MKNSLENRKYLLGQSLLLFSVFIHMGCTSQVSVKQEEDIADFFSISASDVKDTMDVYVEDLVDSFTILPLDNDDKALCAPLSLYIAEQHIGVIPSERRGPYKLFSREGRFLCNVGGVGQGPGEYTSVSCHQIDEKAKRIYLTTLNISKIMVYDFKGEYLNSIPLAYNLRKGSFKIDNTKKMIYCFDVPFGNNPFIWKQDFEGNIKGRVINYPYTLRPDYGNGVQTMYNTETLYTAISAGWEQLEGKKDTLYHYSPETDRIESVFSIDFGKNGQQHHYVNTALNYYIGLPLGYTWNKGPYTMVEYKVIKVDKKIHEASYIKLFSRNYGGLPLDLYYAQFRYGYFFVWMEPIELKEQLAEVLETSEMDVAMRRKIEQLYNSLSENGNNVLLFGKLKQK